MFGAAMTLFRTPIMGAALLSCSLFAFSDEQSLETALTEITRDYDAARYQKQRVEDQIQGIDAIRTRAEALAVQFPKRAEPLIWQGWAWCEYGALKQGLRGFQAFKDCRKKVEEGLAIDPSVFKGRPYVSLGILYSQMPGFPMGFGDTTKARGFFQKALAADPSNIEANYAYGKFLYDEDENSKEAIRYLEIVTKSPQTPGRELSEKSFRDRAEKLISEIKAKAAKQ
jgi:tetratricopeptide (TPR) repeat protein